MNAMAIRNEKRRKGGGGGGEEENCRTDVEILSGLFVRFRFGVPKATSYHLENQEKEEDWVGRGRLERERRRERRKRRKRYCLYPMSLTYMTLIPLDTMQYPRIKKEE